MTDLPRLTLHTAAISFGTACLLVMLLVPSIFALLRADRFTDSTLDYAARFRTGAAADDLARTLERDWRDLQSLAERVPDLEPDQLGYLLTGASGDGRRISWLGYADLGGSVVAATNDLLVGEDVSQRPWFRGGLSGGFAGDVHDAVLLANLLGGDGGEPLRFIDLALPVIDQNGDPAGVLGLHINADWLTGELRESARIYGLDFYLLNPAGEISASSVQDAPSAGELQILRAAQTGIDTGGRERWPDGRDYFSSLFPQVTYGDLPNFGWRMIGRLEATQLTFGVDLIRNGAHWVLLGMIATIGLLTLIFVRAVAAPIGQLSASAERISDGSQEYPPNSGITREAAQLSQALTRLQQDRISEDR
ncbi:MAG: cache domain-containing protein [Paracoccus sp.]|nr:cache domain-containing protein [Paracoccus sp. (in: a-proteobacteria)]